MNDATDLDRRLVKVLHRFGIHLSARALEELTQEIKESFLPEDKNNVDKQVNKEKLISQKTSTELRQEIYKALEPLRPTILPGRNYPTFDKAVDAIMHALKDHVVYVIGDDDTDQTEPGEKINKVEHLRWIHDSNALKAEQRNRADG